MQPNAPIDSLLFTSLLLIICGTPVAYAAAAKPNCGASTAAKHIQLVQPANPPRECIYHINAYSSNVCQLRIDFSLTLAQPSVPDALNGLWYVQCVRDYFAVNGLRFCGSEVAQHIYVPFNRTAGVKNIDLDVVLAARVGSNGKLPTPRWNMVVKQLECTASATQRSAVDVAQDNDDTTTEAGNERIMRAMEPRASFSDDFLIAPPGCLQYYPQSAGTITSFNYNGGVGVYPGNLNYAICFRRQHSTKLLEVKVRYFRLGAEYNHQKFQELDNYCRPQLHSEGLSEDYLLIPQATIVDSNIRATYFCGSSIQGDTITSNNPGPLVMIFNSDGNYKAGREVGFALSYRVL
ncbi:uncharacterized protein LOC118757110 [Rhagoletis pomonella]|uniref:uncharacterized protein LOC118757110 n=1 Tax=Rhagoletis pomonella TaxID=28610 RepID=UPI001781EA51|nr:uncharacterized protein LOC118757110 [Rhagoletis pomonella]